ncbi:MAG: hypothetical protein ACTHJ9_10355 [Rhodanobacter sp.]
MSLLRQILLGAGLLAAVAGYLWLTHARLDRAEARATTAETTASSLRGQLAAAKTSERIVTHYVDRVHVIHTRGATITREVPVYVTPQADAACTVPLGFARVHNAAAAGTDLPGAAGASDAAPSGLALSAVAGTVVDNYTTCHATAAQLTALQEWVRATRGGQ